MAAYVISRVDVHDAESYKKFAKLAVAELEKSDGEFLALGGECEQLEGEGRARNIIIRFPDMAAARAFYDSPGYKEAQRFSESACTRDSTLIEGV